MRLGALVVLLSACSSPTTMPADASGPDAIAIDGAAMDAAASFDAPADVRRVDVAIDDAGSADVGADAGSGSTCSVIRQTGCEATPDYGCRFSGAAIDEPGTGAAACEATGSLPERGELPSGVCFTADGDGRYFDLCGVGFFCAGGSLGCRRYCDPAGAACPAYVGPMDGCAGGCAQTCNSTSTPIAGRPHFAFPAGVGYCEST